MRRREDLDSKETGILAGRRPNSTSPGEACASSFRREAGRGSARVLAAVSGGPDSVCLLDCLARVSAASGPEIVVVHVDHGVRGAESRQDAEFVAALAQRRGLPCRVLAADPARINKNGRPSEGRLRDERYRLFAAALRALGASALFLGHHQDDQVESILLSALRGAGLRGLSGMPRRRPLFPGGPLVVRPFLALPGRLLQDHLAARGLPFVTDSSNVHPRFARNRVRHWFLPLLRQEFGPALDGRLLRLGRVARVLWRRARRTALGGTSPLLGSDALHAALEQLAAAPLCRSLSLEVQRALRTGRSEVFQVAPGVRLATAAGRARRVEAPAPLPPPQVDMRLFEDRRGRILACLRRASPAGRRLLAERSGRIYLDADRVRLPLGVRARLPGDRFHPLGLPRPGKLKAQLIARKVPRSWRDQLAVFAEPERIVAVEGLPPLAGAALTASTARVLRIRVRRGG
ncbi:MAG: tRNA lysidine(34) synthetase TilS [Planctomycetes bacterium]|nr:tRNA lysidine(34) synthetase TilS [Planctomycetota bacterium]